MDENAMKLYVLAALAEDITIASIPVSYDKQSGLPPGFPRGEFLNSRGNHITRGVDPLKLLMWLREQAKKGRPLAE